jgi:hypothetical protein
MAAIPFRNGSGRAVFGLCLLVGAASAAPLEDVPVIWYEDDRRDIPKPEERDPNLLWDGPRESVIRPMSRWTKPSRNLRHVSVLFGGDHVPSAANVNALDEVPNSTWFTNRIGLFPMSADEVARGPMTVTEPDRSAGWQVVSAKTQGVTPGFNVKTGDGAVWVIKFDPPEYPNMASGAGVIANRLFWASGYNVPEDVIVTFRREELSLREGVKIKITDGTKRDMTEADLDAILESVTQRPDGSYRAIASKFLPGAPLGPFDYQGRRDDDPNDRIDHEDRRELRGLYTFVAWLAHFDTKQHNSLDMFVEEDGRSYVRHHLIDFASTLGTGAHGPTMRWGYEYTVDIMPVLGRLLSLGIHEDAWRRLERDSTLAEIGTYQSVIFDPREYKPLQPNSAFANQTTRDAYWAAKIISAFTDAQLRAAAETARYDNPDATAYMARTLAERRDKIARVWFDKIAPLEFFQVADGGVTFRDLGVERNIYPADARYQARVRAVDYERRPSGDGAWSTVSGKRIALPADDTVDVDAYPFWSIDVAVDRGEGWMEPVTCIVSRRYGRVVEMQRDRN